MIKKTMNRMLSVFLAFCIIATLVPMFSITGGAALAENQAIFSVNPNDDGETDNVVVAEYNGVSYVMGSIASDGKAAAIPAAKRSEYGNDIIIDETTAELFTITSELYTYSRGSYWMYHMLTENGYIVDSYGNDYSEHKLATMDKNTVDAADVLPYYNWRFDFTLGWYNRDSSYQICLVAKDDEIYFRLCPSSPSEGEVYTTVSVFSRGCQHNDMEYVPAVAPTCKQDGNDEYWYCRDCDAAGMGCYFSDEDGLNSMFNPPVVMAYGAIDENHDGVCDDCGKNMPVFKKVTEDSQIVAGGKYIIVSKVADKYYAAATGTEEYGVDLPAVEITPTDDGIFTFEETIDAMTFELQFANGLTEWGNGIRYGFVTKFNGVRSEFAPGYGGEFYFSEYDIRGAKYGFYVGLNASGEAVVHSAYSETELFCSYTKGENQLFSMADYTADELYTQNAVYLYRLTDTGMVDGNMYEMTSVKSETDYTVFDENGAEAEGGTNVTGVTDALTQTAINDIVREFVEGESISAGESIKINTGVNISVIEYSEDNSITFSLQPTAVVSVNETVKSYDILDSNFDGVTPMTVILYTGGIRPVQIIHEKQDGTNEYFYPEESEEVMIDGANPFYELYDNVGNLYVLFTVTEFSDIQLLMQAKAEGVTVSGTATSFNSATDDVTIQLIESGASEAAYETVVKGNTAAYSIEGVAPGTYTMKVMKNNHVTREYTVTVGSENVVQDVKIYLFGDVTGDGKVNTKDWARLKAHLSEISSLTGYELACGDVNKDGKVNIKDWARLKAHINESNPLW